MGKWYLLATFVITLYVQLQRIKDVMNTVNKALDIISPFIYGIIIAYVIDILVRWIMSKHLKRHREIAILISYVIFISLIILTLFAIIPQSVTSIKSIVTNFDYYISLVDNSIQFINEKLHISLNLQEILGYRDIQKTQIVSYILKSYYSDMFSALGQVLQTQIKILTAFVASVYIVIDKYKLKSQINMVMDAFLKERTKEFICKIVKIFDKQANSFVIGKIIDQIIIGAMTFITMQILGMPYQTFVQEIIAVTNILPIVGPIIGTVQGLMAVTLKSPILQVEFLVAIVIIQWLDRKFIRPKILGQTCNIQALWILVAVVVGWSISGIIGVLVGIPLIQQVKYLIDEYNQHKIDQVADKD